MTRSSNPSSGCFRGYCNEQKTLRAKLDYLIKWTRDLKTNLMKQSWKVLQTNGKNNEDIHRQIINQIHDDLDDYKRKSDREVGRIHDICDTLIHCDKQVNDSENLRDEILEALRRSPTYSSLEQHMDGEQGPRIRVRPRERNHPGRQHTARAALSTDAIKRKVSQPIALKLLDTSTLPGAKRRTQVDAFKRSRCFTNVEHTETTLGMDYIEEEEDDLSWKPFGPKKPTTTSVEDQPPPSVKANATVEPPKSSLAEENNASDEEFDVAWERRAKSKARKEGTSAPPVEASSTKDPDNHVEVDLDETTQDDLPVTKDQNTKGAKQQTEVVELDDDDDELTTTSTQQANNDDDISLIIDDSDDEIITLSDDERPNKSRISRVKSTWTSSQIQINSNSSQSQSLHNPYRVGIADPSIRSVFLPPPSSNSQQTAGGNNNQRKTQGGNRKAPANKRGANAK